MTTIEKIRAEIERRRKNWLAASRLVKKGKEKAIYAAGKSSAYTEFLSFLDTLQEPDVSEDKRMRKEIARTIRMNMTYLEQSLYPGAYYTGDDALSWLNQERSIPSDLDEAANQYIGYPPEIDEGVITAARRIAFKAGAEWQKNQQPLRFLEIPAGDVAPAEEEGGPFEGPFQED